MADWRYLLFTLNGDGTEVLANSELKLTKPQLSRVLSGPHQITGSIALPYAEMIQTGQIVIRRRKTAIMAEDPNGDIWVGGLVFDYSIDGPVMSLDVAGFSAYPKDEPYDGDYSKQNIDPLQVHRDIWDYLQSQPGGNLGLELNDASSPVKIGTPATDTSSSDTTSENLAGDKGPVRLNWWSTEDLGGVQDTLAKNTPFDYLEIHEWDGDVVRHRLVRGYPTIGVRRDGGRFVLGENVAKMPGEDYSEDDVATAVMVLGAGEGRSRIRGMAAINPVNSLRRVKVIDDKDITKPADAQKRAQEELQRYQPEVLGAGITELVISNHPNAPLGTYDVGDEILYSGDHDWGPVDVWVKIIKLTISPDDGDNVIASVVRSDTL